MATLAEWELKNAKERQAEGIERAKKLVERNIDSDPYPSSIKRDTH